MHGFHLAKFRNLRAAFLAFAVLLQDVLEVLDGVFGDVFLIVLAGGDAFFEFAQKLVGLFTVVIAGAADRNFDELADFFVRDFLAVQTLDVGHKAFAHEVDNLLAVLRLLDDLVNTLFDEDFFEGGHVPFVFEVFEFVGEFPFQELDRVLRVHAQNVGDAEEFRVLVDDHAGAGRNGFFAVGKGVEGVDGDLRVGARLQVHEDFDFFTGVVVHVLDLDFTLVVSLHDAFDQAYGSGAVGNFADGECLVVDLFNLRAHADFSTALAVVVVAHIDDAAGKEIRIERKFFSLEDSDACFAEFAEVVGEDRGRKTHGNAVHTLCQEQRELDRECHRFLAATVVARDPFGRFRVEYDIDCERRESAFDVTWGCGAVAREGVTPVALGVNQQILLTEAHEGIANGGVSVRMVGHGSTDDGGHLLVAAVVVFEKGMQNAALHRLKSVLVVRNGAVQNHIARVVQEPPVVEFFKVVHVRKSKGRIFNFFAHIQKNAF